MRLEDVDESYIADTAPPRDLDRAGRGIDREDPVAPCLQLERDAPRAAANVEHAPPNVTQARRSSVGQRRIGAK
jgi:hypothetical protein